MKAVIMAGGKGTRISELFPDIPKPLIPISNSVATKPVLEWEIESLASQGFKEIIITISFLAEKIVDYFGDGSKWGVKIDYYVEDKPLGNAGALFFLGLTEDFLLINADSIFDIDFNRMVKFHKDKEAQVTLFTHPNSHPYDSGLIVLCPDDSVDRWLTKEEIRPKWYKNRVNAGIHIVNPAILRTSNVNTDFIGKEVDGKTSKVDLDRQILKPLCGTHTMFAYDSPEYVKDMGTPERYKQVSHDFSMGIVSGKNLSNKQKAIFLDRDGTINKYKGFLRDIDDFELIEGAAEAIRLINESGYLAIVVTNQPVIARGEVSVSQLREIHNKMETILGKDGAYIDALYYCPHHPDRGYEGEISELKIECECRKPKPGMLIQAEKDFNIDFAMSWMIGDGENDIKAGNAAGCKTALIGSADYGEDIKADSLFEAVRQILNSALISDME